MRTVYLATCRLAQRLVSHPEVAAGWDRPSALDRMTVGALAAHLSRAVLAVEDYLDGDEPPAGAVLGPAEYFAAVLATDDQDAPLHVGIRRRGEELAAGGAAAVAGAVAECAERLASRLATEPAGRRVRVFGGAVLLLDDYLVTRLVELAVHADDLAVSVGLPPPDLPAGAADVVIRTLVELGRLRHGDVAVVRALARRERDDVSALRVL